MAFLRDDTNESGVIRFSGSARSIANAQRKLRSHFFFILLLYLTHGISAKEARAQVPREYQLKAAFLFNFAQFTQWPTNAFAGPDKPLIIGILGADPFGSALDDLVRGETVQGRRLVVQHFRKVEEIQTCHILFISQSESSRLESELKSLQDKPILTVSDIEDSAFRGIMIRFVTENNKIRLRINLDAIEAAHLTVSSKLLRAAEVIPESKRR